MIGFYSLAVGSVSGKETNAPINKKKIRINMPSPIPVMVLARLAVDTAWQNKQIGNGLLKDAIQRTIIVAEQAGIRALLVHALSVKACEFYTRRGFYSAPGNDMTLMITLDEARNVLR